jgi:rRNA-processing protein FCF1
MYSINTLKQATAARALKDSLQALGPDDDLLIDCIEGETDLFEAIDRLLGRMAEGRAMIAGLETVAADLETRKRRYETRLELDRGLIEQALLIAEIDKLERPLATLSLSARAPKVEVHTPADIPVEFWRAPDPVLDKRALAKALNDGRSVPGACLSNAAPSLTLRTK